ncbi:MAG: DUF4185 domain-containing protein [Gammaproteobacteria bacterium]|nr:DUF4185 domain-containing protein [Gammaproteobacteria bacterium]
MIVILSIDVDEVYSQTLPYPPSAVISDVIFDDASLRTEAPGSDNWPITWATNGNLYTTGSDVGGFGGTNSDGRVSLGVGRVEDNQNNYRGFNIAGGKNAPFAAQFTGKSEGILALGNTLYLWRNGDGSDANAFKFADLYRSDDLGATWQFTGVSFSKSGGDFPNSEGFFSPAFLQFGQGYNGARDQFVYIYAPEIQSRLHWNVQKPGEIALMRVAQSQIEQKSSYQFFAGLSGGNPTWTNSISLRKPVWKDAINGTHRMAVSFNSGINRYLLTTMTIDRAGRIAIYDAPEPWGPWTTVLFEQNESRWGGKVVIFTFVNKWLSSDGENFTIVHMRNDQWATTNGRFVLSTSPPPSPPGPGSVESIVPVINLLLE